MGVNIKDERRTWLKLKAQMEEDYTKKIIQFKKPPRNICLLHDGLEEELETVPLEELENCKKSLTSLREKPVVALKELKQIEAIKSDCAKKIIQFKKSLRNICLLQDGLEKQLEIVPSEEFENCEEAMRTCNASLISLREKSVTALKESMRNELKRIKKHNVILPRNTCPSDSLFSIDTNLEALRECRSRVNMYKSTVRENEENTSLKQKVQIEAMEEDCAKKIIQLRGHSRNMCLLQDGLEEQLETVPLKELEDCKQIMQICNTSLIHLREQLVSIKKHTVLPPNPNVDNDLEALQECQLRTNVLNETIKGIRKEHELCLEQKVQSNTKLNSIHTKALEKCQHHAKACNQTLKQLSKSVEDIQKKKKYVTNKKNKSKSHQSKHVTSRKRNKRKY